MLVEAEDAEDAISTVSSLLEGDVASPAHWSDWHEIGGRWEGYFDGANAAAYSNYAARKKFEEMVEQRQAHMRNLWDRVKNFNVEHAVENYDPYKDFTEKMGVDGFKAWELKRLCGLLDDNWNTDSAVYDLQDWTANLKFFRGRCELAPEMQFMVAVDFHH
jgi:hypothetical protein